MGFRMHVYLAKQGEGVTRNVTVTMDLINYYLRANSTAHILNKLPSKTCTTIKSFILCRIC